ncbi:Potassium transporter [Elasticomyces elasticus]|nr:Potassium transporter [Elasticomyces elasticus]
MGCTGDRERGEVEEQQKWDYITIADFYATSSWTYLSYGWLWFLAIVAVAVYAADTFTAVNLLVYNKWSSQIQPAIPFQYSKWIFAACIIISWVLCGWEWQRAVRVIRRGGVAESYMDPLAVTLQSMRPLGWKRFLVIAELTKSKKGVDYIALFVYFQYKGAIRIILAEGARQVVNALTLYSVMQADLVPTGTHAASHGHTPIAQFFVNVGLLADTNREQAVILFSMLFTLIIWTFSALSLIAALVFYVCFLWHYVPQRDGSLAVYCRRKIDRRLEKIVNAKVIGALEEQERKRKRREMRAAKNGGAPAKLARKPTLPQIATTPELDEDKLPKFGLARQDTDNTISTLPPYSSQPPSLYRQPTLPYVAERPEMPSRSGTQDSAFSDASYASNAPLLSNTTGLGYEDTRCTQLPAPPIPVFDGQVSNAKPLPGRTMTQSTNGTQIKRLFSPVARSGSAMSHVGAMRPPMRQNTQDSFTRPVVLPTRINTSLSFDQDLPTLLSAGPSPLSMENSTSQPFPFPSRQNTQDSFGGRAGPPTRQNTSGSIVSPSRTVSRQHSRGGSFSRPFSPPVRPDTALASASRRTPAPQGPVYGLMNQPLPPIPLAAQTPGPDLRFPPNEGGYTAYDPAIHIITSTTNTIVPSQNSSLNYGDVPLMRYPRAPRRDMTAPVCASPTTYVQRGPLPQRSATAPIPPQRSGGYADVLRGYGAHEEEEETRPTPGRSATARPYARRQRQQRW